MPLIAQGQRRLANTESATDKVKHGPTTLPLSLQGGAGCGAFVDAA